MALSVLHHRDRLGAGPCRLFIDGAWCEGSDGRWMDQRHPATNEVVSRVAVAGPADIDRAVRAARRAFDEGPWPKLAVRERSKILRRFVDLANAVANELTELQVLDNGQPIVAPRSHYLTSGETVGATFDHHIGWIDKLYGHTYPPYSAADAGYAAMTYREPVGVAVLLTPFNSPMFLLCQKLAPALAAGCTVVIKPSESTSLVTQRIVRLLEQAELPPGVVNLVNGPGASIGQALVAHPMVDKISFTGSDAVGRQIAATAGARMARVSLELGGKSPVIVLADAPDKAMAGMGSMMGVASGMTGQTCAATTRMLVHRSIYDAVLEGAAAFIPKVKFGDPFDMTTTSCAMITERQLGRIQGFVDRAREDGARLVAGGSRVDDPELANGNFYRPTLLADVDNAMATARSEIFGPVLCAIPFDDEDEAIRIANDSEYGLAARIVTGNPGRGLKLARALRAGTVGINTYGLAPHFPFGGFKASGIGREGGQESILEFTETKTVLLGLN